MSDITLADYKIQAYLLSNAEDIIEATGRTQTPQFYVESDKTVSNPQTYYIKKVTSQGTSAANVANIDLLSNALTPKRKGDIIDRLPTYIKTKLKPYVKLYKTYIYGTKSIDVELPMVGNLYAQGFASNFTNPGVAISNVEIVRLGGNPAEIDTNIKVKISLYAQKLAHYFDLAPLDNVNVRRNFTGDVPDELTRQIEQGVSWIDLLKINLRPNPDGTANDRFAAAFNIDTTTNIFKSYEQGSYEEQQQRIKLEVGYAPLNQEEVAELGLDPQLVEQYQEMMTSQTQIYYLNLVQNEINYDEREGTSIDLDYVGATGLATTTRRTDLLFHPWFYEQELSLNDQKCKISSFLPQKEDKKYTIPNRSGGTTTKMSGSNSLPAMLIDPFATTDSWQGHVGHSGANQNSLSTRAESIRRMQLMRGLSGNRNNDYDLSDFDDAAKTDTLDSDESKREALKNIQNTIDKLGQIKRNLLMNGLYGAVMYYAGEESDAQGNAAFSSVDNQNAARSRVYLHFAKVSHVLNTVSPTLSPISDDDSRPYIANLGYLYFYSEDSLVSSGVGGDNMTDKDITRGDLQDLIQNAGNTNQEDLLKQLADASTPNVIGGDEVDIEFTYFGDIIEVALEVLAYNNRFGEPLSDPIDRIFNVPTDLEHAGNSLDDVLKTSFVRPFYWDEGILRAAQEGRTTAFGPGATVGDRMEGLYELLGDLLVANITYTNPANQNEEITINMADIPIAMVEFKKWFAANLGGTRRSTYFIKNYITALLRWLSRLIADSINHDRAQTSNQEPPQIIFNKHFYNGSENIVGSLFKGYSVANSSDQSFGALPFEILQEYADKQEETSVHTHVINTISVTPEPILGKPVGKTRKQRDKELGIPHIIINQSNLGALRNISFAREDMPGLREARLFEGEDFIRGSLIREKYNATLELEGNNFFKPGSSFYVEPSALDLGVTDDHESYARQLGLGGYYYVVRVTHSIYLEGKSDWSTAVESKWNAFGDEIGFVPDPDPRREKCVTSYLWRLANALDIENNPSDASQLQRVINDYVRALSERNDP